MLNQKGPREACNIGQTGMLPGGMLEPSGGSELRNSRKEKRLDDERKKGSE